MMRDASFVRKVIYISCIALLLIPLAMIAIPSSRNKDGDRKSGGVLAEIRDDEDVRLSQASLGDIDPASESMKLATLGLRPFAVSMLWNKAHEFEKTRNWDRLTATYNQLMKLQPNFIKLWEYQAHALAFNTSREFDDYEDRYVWVKKGINFLISGIGYNRRDHRIIDQIGYLFGIKIGQSDERWQYRRLLRKDRDFHDELRPRINVVEADKRLDGPDNWLIAQLWYKKSRRMVDEENLPMHTSGALIFYMNVPKQSRNYARDLQVEFQPDEFSKQQWNDALGEWREFGNKQILTTFGTRIQLNGKKDNSAEITKLRDELEALLEPGGRDELVQRKLAIRTEADEVLMARPQAGLTDDESFARSLIERRELIHTNELLEYVSSGNMERAKRLVKDIDAIEQRLLHIDSYRSTSNYPYWEVRCEAESTDEANSAREDMYHAYRLVSSQPYDEYVRDPDTREFIIDPETGKRVLRPGAVTYFENAFEKWAKVFEDYPHGEENSHHLDMRLFSEDLERAMMTYHGLIGGGIGSDIGGDQAWPADFPLQDLIDTAVGIHGGQLPTTEKLMQLRPEFAKEVEEAKKAAGEKTDSDTKTKPDEENKNEDDKKGDEKSDDDKSKDDSAKSDEAKKTDKSDTNEKTDSNEKTDTPDKDDGKEKDVAQDDGTNDKRKDDEKKDEAKKDETKDTQTDETKDEVNDDASESSEKESSSDEDSDDAD